MIELTIENPVEVSMNKKQARFLSDCLSFETSYWEDGPFRKQERIYRKQVFSRRTSQNTYFWTGLLPRVLAWGREHDLEISVTDSYGLLKLRTVDPVIEGLTFKPHQVDLLNIVREKQRGVIKATVRSGKTMMMMGITASFPRNFRTLILAHTTNIIQQTVNKFREYRFTGVQQIGAGVKADEITGSIVIALINSFKNLPLHEYRKYFDVLIVDEAHRVSKMKGMYRTALEQIHAPVRLGFTGTMPVDPEAQFTLEGLIGEQIGELGMKEAIEKKIISKPKMIIKKTPFERRLRGIRTYQESYELAIVENEVRNCIIANDIIDFLNEQMTVLVVVTRIAHGQNIYRCLREISGLSEADLSSFARFLTGQDEAAARETVRMMLDEKDIRCVICTPIWREGTDIPSLNVVINAGGMKSEIATLQGLGRALTPSKGKEFGIILDYFDPSNRYLVDHFGHRVSLYCDEGWM